MLILSISTAAERKKKRKIHHRSPPPMQVREESGFSLGDGEKKAVLGPRREGEGGRGRPRALQPSTNAKEKTPIVMAEGKISGVKSHR